MLKLFTASGDMTWAIFLQVPYEQSFLSLPDHMFFVPCPQHTLPLPTSRFHSSTAGSVWANLMLLP